MIKEQGVYCVFPYSTVQFLFFFFVLGLMQDVKEAVGKLRGPVEEALTRGEEPVSVTRPLETQRIQEHTALLRTGWDKLNKLHQDRLK